MGFNVRLFGAVLDCLRHLVSTKLFRWFYGVVDRLKLLDIVSRCSFHVVFGLFYEVSAGFWLF